MDSGFYYIGLKLGFSGKSLKESLLYLDKSPTGQRAGEGAYRLNFRGKVLRNFVFSFGIAVFLGRLHFFEEHANLSKGKGKPQRTRLTNSFLP